MRPTIIKGLQLFKRLNQQELSLSVRKIHPSHLIQSITMLYLPKKGIIKEPAGIENSPYIKDTLDVHKVKRKINDQGKTFLEF